MKYCLTGMIAVILIISLSCNNDIKIISSGSVIISLANTIQSSVQMDENASFNESKPFSSLILLNSTSKLSHINKNRFNKPPLSNKIEIKSQNPPLIENQATIMIQILSSKLPQKLNPNKVLSLSNILIPQIITTKQPLTDLLFTFEKEPKPLKVLSGRRSKVRLGLF